MGQSSFRAGLLFVVAVMTIFSVACGSGNSSQSGNGSESGNSTGRNGDPASGADSVSAKWSDAARAIKTARDAYDSTKNELLRLPSGKEQQERWAKAKKDFEDACFKAVAELPALDVRSESPDVLEVSAPGKVSSIAEDRSVWADMALRVPVTVVLKRAVGREEVEIRTHAADGTLLSKTTWWKAEEVSVGEKEKVTLGVPWDCKDAAKAGIAYVTLKCRKAGTDDGSDAPSGNTAPTPRSNSGR